MSEPFSEIYKLAAQQRDLRPDKSLSLSAELQPLLARPEARVKLGIDANVAIGIKAADKEFLLLDLRETPDSKTLGYKKLLEHSSSLYAASYLLIDATFGNVKGRGFKAINENDAPVKIGRNHLSNRFDYPARVSRNHFEVAYRVGQLSVDNQSPTNRTIVFWGRGGGVTNNHGHSLTELVMPRGSELAPTPTVAGLAEKARHGADRSLVMPEKSLYAVFDGVGVAYNAGLAAQVAKDSLGASSFNPAKAASFSELENLQLELLEGLQNASADVAIRSDGGATTGVAMRLVRSDTLGSHAIWASAGDSRIYVFKAATNKIEQLSHDEGQGHVLFNYLGADIKAGQPLQPTRVRQTGRMPVAYGDRLILVSDGITGDYESDILSDQELIAACQKPSAQAVADELLSISRKRDDKTAVVIDVGY